MERSAPRYSQPFVRKTHAHAHSTARSALRVEAQSNTDVWKPASVRRNTFQLQVQAVERPDEHRKSSLPSHSSPTPDAWLPHARPPFAFYRSAVFLYADDVSNEFLRHAPELLVRSWTITREPCGKYVPALAAPGSGTNVPFPFTRAFVFPLSQGTTLICEMPSCGRDHRSNTGRTQPLARCTSFA